MNRITRSLALVAALAGGLALNACGNGESAQGEDTVSGPGVAVDVASNPDLVSVDEPVDVREDDPAFDGMLPEEFRQLWAPWTGDLPGMIDRRAIRVVVPFGGYQFYYDRGRPQGAIIELLQKFETFLNKELDRRHIRVYVVPVPMSRDRLIPDLLVGQADLVAADLTMTEHRNDLVKFTRPLIKGVNEVVVTGPASPKLDSIADLSGREIVVRESSSYYEHLVALGESMKNDGKPPPEIRKADELLEAEDLLEMLHAGMIPLTVMDDYKAEFWSGVFPDLVVRNDLVINKDGSIA